MIPDPADGSVDPVSACVYDCAWRTSVEAGFRSDHDAEFTYGHTPDEAAASIEFMISEWERQSTEFFTPLTSWPDDFLAAARAAELQPAHPMTMLVCARVANAAHNPALAGRLARTALPGT